MHEQGSTSLIDEPIRWDILSYQGISFLLICLTPAQKLQRLLYEAINVSRGVNELLWEEERCENVVGFRIARQLKD